MISIILEKNRMFRVNANDVSTAPLKVEDLVTVMSNLEVDLEEVEMAVTDLVRNEHKYAIFGINRRFLFTE